MIIQKIRSQPILYPESGTIKVPANAKSGFIKNTSATPALLWGVILLSNTDAPIGLPNYDTDTVLTQRADEIDLVFTPADGKPVVLMIDAIVP